MDSDKFMIKCFNNFIFVAYMLLGGYNKIEYFKKDMPTIRRILSPRFIFHFKFEGLIFPLIFIFVPVEWPS